MVLGLGVPVVRRSFPLLHLQDRDRLTEEAHVAGPEVAERVEPGKEVASGAARTGRGVPRGGQEAVDPRVLLVEPAGQPPVPLGREVEPELLPLGHLLDQPECAGPGQGLVQPPLVGPFQGLQQPRRQGLQRGTEPFDLLVEQGVVLAETGRLAHHFQEDGAEVVDDHAAVGTDLAGALDRHQRRPFARLAGADQFLAHGGEEAHHQLPRFRPEVLDQGQMSDQLVHGRTDLVRVAPIEPAGQLRQGDRALGLAEHVEDPPADGVLQLPGDPAGPAVVHHVRAKGLLEAQEVLDPRLAEHAGDDPGELAAVEGIIDVLLELARPVGGQQVEPGKVRSRVAKS